MRNPQKMYQKNVRKNAQIFDAKNETKNSAKKMSEKVVYFL